MTVLRWLWGGLVAIGAVLAAVFLGRRLKAPAPPPAPPIDLTIERARQGQVISDAKTAIQIGIARATTQAERSRLVAVLTEPESDEQNERLIAEANRVRGE